MQWHEYFVEIAKTVSKKSKDPSTKIGAVIVGHDNSIRSTGYNSFPKGVIDKTDDHRILLKIQQEKRKRKRPQQSMMKTKEENRTRQKEMLSKE